VTIDPSSLWVPTWIIAIVYIPYVYRPLRGQVLSVREKEYVEASISQGASNTRLMFAEILPNVVSTAIVLLPLMIATTILTEAALSFLGIGVQAPQASWGTIIDDGQNLLYTRPLVAIVPGIFIVLTVLALNLLGDRLIYVKQRPPSASRAASNASGACSTHRRARTTRAWRACCSASHPHRSRRHHRCATCAPVRAS
jgi:ABC-type dipeptide/oligopeptide/nickel transport system permease subunit